MYRVFVDDARSLSIRVDFIQLGETAKKKKKYKKKESKNFLIRRASVKVITKDLRITFIVFYVCCVRFIHFTETAYTLIPEFQKLAL